MVNILRTRFKKEIVSEFLPPAINSNKVIILCAGMPSYPGRRNDLMEFLSQKGYWVFLPRYRGTWESGGSFLKRSPHQDILDITDSLEAGFIDLWNKKKYAIRNPNVFVIGSSFGGPAAILSSLHPKVKKIVALSPVIDWNNESELEPIDLLGKFTRSAFGNGYRFEQRDWDKLKSGKFYSPLAAQNKLKGANILLFHAKDDEVVYYEPTKVFSVKTNSTLVTLKTGGHLSISQISTPQFWKKISSFITTPPPKGR